MAGGTVLKMKFDTMSGSRTWSFRNSKTSSGIQNIRALGQAMIENGTMFQYQPIRLTEAKEVTTSENVYDLES